LGLVRQGCALDGSGDRVIDFKLTQCQQVRNALFEDRRDDPEPIVVQLWPRRIRTHPD
jgi:hypothetical protein